MDAKQENKLSAPQAIKIFDTLCEMARAGCTPEKIEKARKALTKECMELNKEYFENENPKVKL